MELKSILSDLCAIQSIIYRVISSVSLISHCSGNIKPPRKISSIITISGLLAAVISANATASSYQIIDLGTFGGTSSRAYAINASGQVAGVAETSDGNFRAFRYEGGTLKNLGTYDINRSRGLGINDNGVVVGDDGYDSFNPKGKAWKNNGVGMSGISTGYTEHLNSIAYDVNNHGVVVGGNIFPWSNGGHAFYYDSGTYLTDLGTLHPDGKTGSSSARAINDDGQIIGSSNSGYGQPSRAFLYENGVMSDLGSLGYSASASDINELGVAVGVSMESRYGQNHGVIFDNGMVFDLGTLGGNFSAAQAINDHGHVVGSSRTVSGDTHAFLYDGESMIDLNDLLGEDSGWTNLVSAYDINNHGEIVGQGLINGEYHAYLIATVPVPSALWLFCSALIGLVGFAKHKKA